METLSYCELMERCIALEAEVAELRGRNEYALVPVNMSPEMMRAVQLKSELGGYAAANLSGAYSLFREFWDVAITEGSK